MIKNAIKNKEIRRNIIILVIFLISTWLIGINKYFSSSTKENNLDKKKTTSLYPEAVLSVQNCEQIENRFFTLHEDPQIYILPPKHKISSTMIEFAEPIPIDSSIRIYYAKKNENLNEDNSVLKLLPKGSSEVTINLPSGIFTLLRYDIDIFGEWYEIKGIYFSEAIMGKSYSALFTTLIISVCIFVLWIICIRTGIIKTFYNKITNLFIIAKEKNVVTKDATIVINTITIKANKKRKYFLLAIFLLILLKLILIMSNRMYPSPDAVHDDMLMYSRAVSISNGKWLGLYNNLTLAKGAFFSIWLAFLHILSVPMLIGNEILYIASCLFLVWCINDIVPNKKILFLIFTILVFNPLTLGYSHLLRIYRDSIFPTLIIFVFAGTIGMFLKKDNCKKMLFCSSLSGIFLAAAWHTREDTFWILPFIIVADIIIAIYLIAEKKYKDNIKKYIYLILPFVILLISNLFVSSLNYIAYGRFITNDYMSKDFKGAYGALTRVAHEKFDYYNPVPEEVRMKIYQISPSFNELRPHLDGGGPLEGYKDFGKNQFKWPLHDYYAWFMWALRDAVAACGYYENPQNAKEYYERLAKEVNNACDTGLLPSRTGKRATIATPFSKNYINPSIEHLINATLFIVRFNDIYINNNIIFFKQKDFSIIRDMELYLNQLSVAKINFITISGWVFDDSENIVIKITESNKNEVNASIIKNDSKDVYDFFLKNNETAYKTALNARFIAYFEYNPNMDYYLNFVNEKNEIVEIPIKGSGGYGGSFLTLKYYIDNIVYPILSLNKVERIKNKILNFIVSIYKFINPLITLVAIFILFLLTIIVLNRLIKKLDTIYLKEIIILWGLLLMFISRKIMIAYVSASSFPAIIVLYLSSSYPIMIIFNCISIYCLFSLFKKYIFVRKHRSIANDNH